MKTVHPPEIGLNRHCLPVQGHLRMFFSMTLGFHLHAPQQQTPPLCPAEEVWAGALQSLGPQDVLDLGLPKKEAEWLMAGEACAPEGSMVEGLPVQVTVGNLQRNFLVNGPCEDQGLSIPLQPRPFARMPMQWAYTYGGIGHAENPLGCGMPPLAQEKNLGMPRPLPNIFAEGESLASFTRPACPGPRQLTVMPPVVADAPLSLGTYDAQWLQKRWPGIPDDFDWGYYNMAQQAQRQATPFVGQEKVRITNMHEKYAILEGTVPQYGVRFFANYGSEESPDWREAPVRFDTIWLFPNACLGMVFWRAHVPVQDERGSDICTVAISYTPPSVLDSFQGGQASAQHCIATAEQSLITDAHDVPLMQEDMIPSTTAFAAGVIPTAAMPTAQSFMPKMPTPEVAVPHMPTPEIPPMPPLADMPEVPSAAHAPLFDMQSADVQQEMQEMMDIANAELAKYDLPPIQKEDLVQQMQKMEDMQKKSLELQNMPQPSLEETLMQAGYSPEQAHNLMKAMELQPPSSADFLHKEEYEAALQSFLQKFTTLTDAPESVQKQLLMGLRMQEGDFSHYPQLAQVMDKVTDQVKDMTANPEALAFQKMVQQFSDQGMPLDQAQNLAKAIQIPMPENISAQSMEEYMQVFEQTAQFPSGSMTDVLAKNIGNMRFALYSQASLHKTLQELTAQFPEQSAQLHSFSAQLPQMEGKFSSKQLLAMTPTQDFTAMAKTCGIVDPRLLLALKSLDPLPEENPPTAPTAPQESIAPTAEALPPLADLALQTPPVEEIFNEPQNGPELVRTVRWIASLEPAKQAHYRQKLEQGNYSHFEFNEMDCSGCDFSGLLLDNAHFTQAHLQQCHFDNCQLQQAQFIQCTLHDTSFLNAHMGHTILSRVEGTEVILSGAILQDCRIQHSALHAVQAEETIFDMGSIRHCHISGNFSKASFTQSFMEDVQWQQGIFDHADFTQTTFKQCQLQGQAQKATFMEASIEQCTFTAFSLKNARLYSVLFTEVLMQGVHAEESSWSKVEAKHVNMDLAILTDALLEECVFQHFQAARMSARGAHFIACNLRNAPLQRLDIFEGSLRSSLLDGANLEGASLYGADLTFAEITTNTHLLAADLTNTCLTRLIP